MSGQDEPDPVSCKEHFPENHYNKSFIDQVCLVKMAGYWPHSFFLQIYGPPKGGCVSLIGVAINMGIIYSIMLTINLGL